MAFQAPSVGQEKANRKILEQLEEQKKRLRMQAVNPAPAAAPLAPPTSTSLPSPVNPVGSMPSDNHHMTPAQRTALQHAHANSVGYFITQDSSFGNLILPVLPRLTPPAVEK